MKKSICIFASIFMFFALFAQTEEKKFNLWGSGEVFKLSPVTDGILLGTGALFSGSSFVCGFVIDSKKPAFDGNILDKSSVNELDQIFMQPYSKKLHIVGTATLVGALCSPALLAFAPSEEWMTVGVMYLESLMFAYGMKEFAKFFVTRARPYMYFDGYPQDKVDDGDWCKSFPSGHTTMAFAGATFTSFVFSKYFPDSPWRWVITGGSYALAVGTGILRLCSGNHFLTDVLTGATLGTICGFVIPWIHTFYAGNNSSNNTTSDGLANNTSKTKAPQLEITPLSIGVGFKF
ncbi:MAG: phosphatase PAP2 family protein [Treponema sp.]|nr:phosphatase PAP2 family protein [Treponema sp.]